MAAPRAAFFTKDMALAEAPPAESSAVRAGSFFQAWAAGDDYPTWRAPPTGRDVAIEDIVATVVVRVTAPVARTFRFPDIMVYAGAGEAWMTINTTQTPPVLVPGETYSYELPIPSPPGGLWLPAGEPFGLKVVPVMHQNDQADVEILVGTTDGSRATWTERAVEPIAVGRHADGSATGDLAGSEYAGAAAPPTARHREVVEVAQANATLLVWMNTTASQGVPDLDLEIVSPDGESVVFVGTPTPHEHARLAPFNLAGAGAYTVVVHNYGSARASFSLEWVVG